MRELGVLVICVAVSMARGCASGEVVVSGSGKSASISNGLTKINVVLRNGDAIGFEIFSLTGWEKQVALVELSSSGRWKAKTVESGKKGTGSFSSAFFTLKNIDTSGTNGTPEFGPESYITVSLEEGNTFPYVEFKLDLKSFDREKWESAWNGRCPMYFLRCTLDEAQCFYQGGVLYPSPTYDPYPMTMPQMTGDWSNRWSYAPAIGAHPIPAMGLWAPQIKKFVAYEFQHARSTDRSEKFIANAYCAGEDEHPKQFFTLLYPYAKNIWRALRYPENKPVVLHTHFRIIYALDLPSHKDPNDWVIHYIYHTYIDLLPPCPKMNDLSWMKGAQANPDAYGQLLLYDMGKHKSYPKSADWGRLFSRYEECEKQFFKPGTIQLHCHQIGKTMKYAYLVNDQKKIQQIKDQIEYLIPKAIEKTYENGDRCWVWNHPLEGSFNDGYRGEKATTTQHMFNWGIAEAMLYVYLNEKDERLLKYIDGILLWTKHYLYDRAGMADIPQSVFSMGAGNGGEFCLDYYYAFRDDPERKALAKQAFELAKMVVFRNVYYYTDDPDQNDILDPAFLLQAVNSHYWLGMVTWGEMGRIPEMLIQIYAETGDPVAKYITRGCLERFFWGAKNTKIEFWENIDVFGESNGEKGKGSGGWGGCDFRRYAEPLGDAVMRIVMGRGGAMAFCKKTFACDIADYSYEPESNFEFKVTVDRSLSGAPSGEFGIIATAPRHRLHGKKVFVNGNEIDSSQYVVSTIGEDLFIKAVKPGDVVTIGDIRKHKPLEIEKEKVRTIPVEKYIKEDAFAMLNLYPVADVKIDATWQGEWGGFIPGKRYVSGIPCYLIDPVLNSDRAAVSGGVQIPVEEKIKAVFVFASTGGKTGKIGEYTLSYADNSTQTFELIGGMEAFAGSPFYKKNWQINLYPGFLPSEKFVKSIVFSQGCEVFAITFQTKDTERSTEVLENMRANSEIKAMIESNYNYQSPQKISSLDLPWWNRDWHYRTLVQIGSGSIERIDAVVRIKEDFSLLLEQAGIQDAFDTNSVRVVEYDASGKMLGEIPAQFDCIPGESARGEVVWIIPGKFRAGEKRNFCIYFDTVKNPKKPSGPEIKYTIDESLLTVETGKGGVKFEFSLDGNGRGPRIESVIFDNEGSGDFDQQPNVLGPSGYNEGYGDLTNCQDSICWFNFGGLQENNAVAEVIHNGPVSLTVRVSNKELYGGGKGSKASGTKVVGIADWYFRFYKNQKRIEQWVNIDLHSGQHKWTRELQVRYGLNSKEGALTNTEGGVYYAANEEIAAVAMDDEQARKRVSVVYTDDGGVIQVGFERLEKKGRYYPGRWLLVPGGKSREYYASQVAMFPFVQYAVELLGSSGIERPLPKAIQPGQFDTRIEIRSVEGQAEPAKITFSDSVYIILGKKDMCFGLKRKDNPDEGRSKSTTKSGKECGYPGANPHGPGRMFYFDIDDRFIADAKTQKFTINIEYFDEGVPFGLEYDSTDESVQKCPIPGAFKDYPEKVEIEDSGKWKTFTFNIEDARFNNSCNGADFRFSGEGEFYIAKITIMKVK